MTTFSFDDIKCLLANDQKEYITKFFIPLRSGDHVVLGENNTYEIVEQAVLKKVYFSRLSTDLNKFYFNEYTNLKSVVCELNKPQLYESYFNVCPAIKSTYKPYKEFSSIEKEGVELFLQYIMDVLASDCEESYTYILKWLSNMLKGNKNDACIYLKGGQGIGKSTLSDFLKDHVIGTDLLLETGSNPLKNKFNNILQGKLLVQFSELENFGVNEWASISSTLKRIITSTTYTIEGKGKDPIQIRNINNYILDSNNDAIKDDEGRRYFIADVSHKYQGDKNGYFTNLRKKCFNNNVGAAFYSFMLEFDTKGFKPQDYPMTKSKLNAISKRLDSVYKFLRDNYVLKKTAIFKKPKELFIEYAKYCEDRNIKHHELIEFRNKLTQINIESVVATAKRTPHYRVSIEELNELAERKKWIHENDMECSDDMDKIKMINISQIEYDELRNRIKELEKQLTNTKIKDTDIDIDSFLDSVLDSVEETIILNAVEEISDEYEFEESDDEIEESDDEIEESDDEIEESDDEIENEFINRLNNQK
jgi:hypothetical protein